MNETGSSPAGGYQGGVYPPATDYPLTFSVDYPDRPLNRLSSFFRILWIIPIAFVAGVITTGAGSEHGTGYWWSWAAGGILFFPVLLMLLFRGKYPRWWFDWNVNLAKFSLRVAAYFALLNDVYPSSDEEQTVHLQVRYPDVKKELKAGLPLIKWFLAIPHYVVLAFLFIGVIGVVIISWFVIIVTGRYPRPFFNFVVGVMRWGVRVNGYAFLLVTDIYPPFSLK